MRIFSILAAVIVASVLALSILARPQLLALLGMNGSAEAAQPAEQVTQAQEPAAEPDTPETERVKVVVEKFMAQQVDSAVILRGQTEALRQVDVRAETSATVASEPLRKGTRVAAALRYSLNAAPPTISTITRTAIQP